MSRPFTNGEKIHFRLIKMRKDPKLRQGVLRWPPLRQRAFSEQSCQPTETSLSVLDESVDVECAAVSTSGSEEGENSTASETQTQEEHTPEKDEEKPSTPIAPSPPTHEHASTQTRKHRRRVSANSQQVRTNVEVHPISSDECDNPDIVLVKKLESFTVKPSITQPVNPSGRCIRFPPM